MQIFFIILALLIMSGNSLADELPDDKQAIKECVLNYIDGWYAGNAERMEKALHPELTKVGIRTLKDGEVFLDNTTKSTLVLFANRDSGKLPEQERKIKLEIYDIHGNIATVKASSAKFIDYCHLVKLDGEWKILNVIWEPVR